MKNELLELYKTRQTDFKSVIEKFPEDDLAGPFLMSPSLDYNSQPNRLLIIGQETNDWSYHIDDLEKQMEQYEDFNVGIEYYASPFWNITRKIETALDNKPYSCAWTNLNKFDLDAGRPYGEYEATISKLDDIFLSELKIVKPDFCLFYTGPSFDYRLRTIFQDIEFVEIPNFTVRQFCKLKHPDLPENSYRSHHPKSLRIRYLEDNFINYIGKQKKQNAR
jgi:hypothetical protein